MKLFKQKILFLCLCLFSISLPLHSENNLLGISLNFPGLGIRYVCHTKNIFELRLQYFSTEEYTTKLLGIRYYRILSNIKNKSLAYYLGAEGAFFEHSEKFLPSNVSYSANRYLFGIYIGIEKFLSQKFSINFDLGPYIATGTIGTYSSSMFDFVLNVSINYYFGR